MVEKNEITGCAAVENGMIYIPKVYLPEGIKLRFKLELDVKRHVKHKKRENPKKAVKKQNTPYKLRIYGVYEV